MREGVTLSGRYFFSTMSWKKTALGTSIPLAASQTLDSLRGLRPILLMGGIHGDEPEGVALAEATLSWLEKGTTGKSHNPASPPLAPWIVIPCLNVDGYRAKTRVNGRGVDLNRNYPSKDWSAVPTKPRYNPGPSPASEPEIQGVVEIIRDLQPRLIIHCHSWEPMIVCTGHAGKIDAERLAQASSYKVVEEIGYPTPGSLSRYGWHDNGIPVICIEEQEQLADLSSVWPRFQTGIHAIFRDQGLREDSRP